MSRAMIPLSVPNLKGNELRYVTEAVTSEWVSTGGPYVREFETKMANYVKSLGAVSCQSGTAGLHVALQLSGVAPGHEVIVPALTFIAAVNPVKYLGAEPVFMDCDDSLCIDPIKLEAFCREECQSRNGVLYNRKTGKHIKALVVVHVFGNIADMERIMEVAREFGLLVIEDATEALGSYCQAGRYEGKHSGTIGDVGVYSFNGNKIITTGGGGMLVSNNQDLLIQARHITTQAKVDEIYFIHDDVGYNYRMTNIQAALGLAQLEQLEDFVAIKKKNYMHYQTAIGAGAGLSLLSFREDIRPNYWFYSLICHDSYPLMRDALIAYLAENSVQSRPIWGLICDQKPYVTNQAFKVDTAREYWKRVVNLPCSSNLQSVDVQYVVDCLLRIAQ